MKGKFIFDNQDLTRRIEQFLKPTSYDLIGGSIVNDGKTVTIYVGIDKGCAVTVGSLGERMKNFLEVDRLVLNGIVY